MKTKYAVLSSLFFIIQLVGVLPLRAEHYYFKQISLKEGLPSNVRCILRDEQGFVWIGTKSGLGKFDGHELKRYKHQANDPNSLLHNLIYQIAEDKQHNIWVLTEKGIARYQQQSNDFTFPTDEDGKNITAYSFCLVPDGILFGGKDRIYKYSYNDSSLRLLQYFNANSFKINALSMWDSKTLLCCSRWTGIYLVDLHTGEHRRPPFDCGPEITTMMTDSRKRIWIAPYSGGLRCYSYDGKLLASYSTRNSALSNDIVLSLAEREGQLWIGTDGGGINIEKVKNKAISSGTITPEQAENMTDKEVIDLLFRPSFSTAEKITDVSGRGVGLDVVKTKIEELGGNIECKSVLGEGSSFIIRLPLTLAIIQALMVELGTEKYAIPLGNIQTIEDVLISDVKYVQTKEVINLRGTVIPLIRLDQILDVEPVENDSENLTVVIVKKGDKLAGLVVDNLIGQQEIVIKSIGNYINCSKMIGGATILGDGEIALILEVNSLV